MPDKSTFIVFLEKNTTTFQTFLSLKYVCRIKPKFDVLRQQLLDNRSLISRIEILHPKEALPRQFQHTIWKMVPNSARPKLCNSLPPMPKAVGKKTESRLLSILFVSATSIKGNDSLGNTKNFSTPTGFSKGEEFEIMTDDYKLFCWVH